MSGNLYTHRDGATLAFDGRALIATDALGKTVSLSIAPHELQSLGITMIGAEDEEFVSEHAGATLGADLVQELYALRGRPQAEAFRVVHDKLHALMKLEHADRAAGAFALQVVNVLELGILNLPAFDEELDK